MAKNINIHIKAKGTQQAKQQLDGVSRSTRQMGDSTEKAGTKAQRGAGWITSALSKIAGPAGVLAVITAFAAGIAKVAKFFDNLKTKADQAVKDLEGVRSKFDEIFEAMDAYDEKSRQRVTAETATMLQKTGVSTDIGLPVTNAYIRQFKALVESGQITTGQYNQGLENILGYSARHGGAATTDLIGMMAGWGMNAPEQQSAFYRMISKGAAASGLTDAELIGALSRGVPTIKAMGWTPEQAVESIAVLAKGESGRKKLALPASTIQALGMPQETGAAEYGISEDIIQDPQQLLRQIQLMNQTMGQKEYYRMLTKIYGTEGAAGVYKLATAEGGQIREALTFAAGPEGAEADIFEEQQRQTTLETKRARTEATIILEQLGMTEEEKNMENIRLVGEQKRKMLRIRQPIRQRLREFFTIGEELEKEQAAQRLWAEKLSPEEREGLLRQHRLPLMTESDALREAWRQTSSEQRFEQLTTPQIVNIHYHNETIYQPVSGSQADREIGERYRQD